MTVKTKELLSEMTEALYQKKAVLLTGNTGVGKTYLAKKISEQLSKNEYSCFPVSKDQTVNVEIISCHNSVTYEDVVGGITAGTESDKIVFEYKDKIIPVEAKADIHTRAKSYSLFCKRYNPEIGLKFSMKNMGINNVENTKTFSIPLYLIWMLETYLKK